MIPKVAKLGTGFVGAGLYYMHDKRQDMEAAEARRPSAAEYFLTDKGPAQTADRVGFTATRNLASQDPMKGLRQMAFTAAHAHDIRVAAVGAAAKAAGMSYDAYVKATNPFRGRKGDQARLFPVAVVAARRRDCHSRHHAQGGRRGPPCAGASGPPVRDHRAHRHEAPARAPHFQPRASDDRQIRLCLE